MKRNITPLQLPLAVVGSCCFASLFAQKNSITITGKVTDQANGPPLLSATICVKRANQSIAVDAHRNFSIYSPANVTSLVSNVC